MVAGFAIVGFDFDGWFQKDEYRFEYGNFFLSLKREIESGGEKKPLSNQIAIEVDMANERECSLAHEAGLSFLSELSWLFRVRYFDVVHMCSSVDMKICGNFVGNSASRRVIDFEKYKPMNLNKEQKLALGFYKDGISLNSVYYRFLSLFKVLNIFLESGAKQKGWLEKYLSKNSECLQGSMFNEAKCVAKRLYKFGRCAIAHAFGTPVVDVNSMEDYFRINRDLGLLMKAIEYYMIHEMDIPSARQLGIFGPSTILYKTR